MSCERRELYPDIRENGVAELRITAGEIFGRSSAGNVLTESEITDINLISYRSGILADVKYYSRDAGDFVASGSELTLNCIVQGGYDYSFYAIANLGDLTDEIHFPFEEEDLAGLRVEAAVARGGCLPMAGSATLTAGGARASLSLRRLVARVDCRITLPEDVVLESVRLCQTPRVCMPFGGPFRADPDDVEDGDCFSFSTSPASGFSETEAGRSGYTCRSEALYVFENMQGKTAGNDDKWKKYPTDETMAESATYVRVSALFPQGRVIYRFYLGADCLNDYNLERNRNYTLNISIWDADASKSTWSMVDLRCSDNWPEGKFYAAQVRSFDFRSSDISLTAPADACVRIQNGGNGRWYVYGLTAGSAGIDVKYRGDTVDSIVVTVSGWDGRAGDALIGLSGNAACILQDGIIIDGVKRTISSASERDICDRPSLLSESILKPILHSPATYCSWNAEVPEGKLAFCSSDPTKPTVADSIFVYDPTGWESLFGARRRFAEALSLSNQEAGIRLSVPAVVSNGLYTQSAENIEFEIHDYSLLAEGRNMYNDGGEWDDERNVYSFLWTNSESESETPVPETADVRIGSRLLSNSLDENGAMSYSYSGGRIPGTGLWSMVLNMELNESPALEHACGLVEVYADVTNRRSGIIYRTPLFREEHFLHIAYGGYRTYHGETSTMGSGNYCYDAITFAVMPVLSANTAHDRGRVNKAVELLAGQSGIFRFTGNSQILYPYRYDWYYEAEGAAYVFVGQKSFSGGGVGVDLYNDYFMEYTGCAWSEPWQLYSSCNDEAFNERGPFLAPVRDSFSEIAGAQIGTADPGLHPKNSRYHDKGYLLLENWLDFDDSTWGWVDYATADFPRI